MIIDVNRIIFEREKCRFIVLTQFLSGKALSDLLFSQLPACLHFVDGRLCISIT